MEKPKLRQTDFLFSLVLIAFGIAILVSASRMPWTNQQSGISSAWYLSPGLFPALLGILLIVFSLDILMHAISAGGHRKIGAFVGSSISAVGNNRRLHKVLLIILVIGVYISLIGHVNYYVASAVYLFMFMLLFHHPASRSRVKNVLTLLAVAVLVPLVTGYLFSHYLNVPLPG